MKTHLFTSLIVLAFAGSPSGKAPLTVAVTPLQSFAPANLTVRFHVQADADNHALEIVAESATYYRSSTTELDGADAPSIVSLELRNVPSGELDVTGVLIDVAGKRRTAVSQHVIVISPGGDPQ
jgi:hypothetical protein